MKQPCSDLPEGLLNVARFLIRANSLMAILAFLFVLPGCVTSPVYKLPAPKLEVPSCVRPVGQREALIGVAISGGGSRAALFAAAGLEALAKIQVGAPQQSLLEQVSLISSVSGGSLATSYFAAQKPPRETPVLTPDGNLTEAYRTFFAKYQETMDRDYEDPLLWRNLMRLRWFNPAWTARSLAEYLNGEFLNDLNFAGVSEREARGDIPRLLINTTLYNDGRRLVFSTLPKEETQYDLIKDLAPTFTPSFKTDQHLEVMRSKWASLQTATPQALDMDQCPIRLAAAVAASMSFPPVIGPISFTVEGKNLYWHAGDGGLSDNAGLESLSMVMLNQYQQKQARRLLLISFDSSFPFSVGGERLSHFPEGFDLFNYDFSRIPGIMEERALAFRIMFMRTLAQQGVLPDPRHFKLITLSHIDAQWKEDLSDLPAACKDEKVALTSPPEVKKRLSSIVTRLWIKSECDRALVTTAAAKLVEGKKEEILKFLQEPLP